MAKKKSKKGKQDTRGYQTGPIAAKPVPQPLVAPTKKRNLQSVHTILDQLRLHVSLTLPRIDDQQVDDRDTPRFRTRLDRTVDRLLSYGFTWDQIGMAVSEVGVPKDDTLLDWLCWNLSTEELPAVFTEGSLRDAATTSGTVSVIAPLPIQHSDNRNFAAASEANSTPDVIHYDTEAPHNLVETRKKKEEDDANDLLAKQKAWLLSQYEFENEEEEESTLAPPTSSATTATTVPKVEPRESVATAGNVNDNGREQVDSDQGACAPSPDTIELQTLQSQLDELQADLANDANNYMRSKQEIKAMRQQVKQLKKRVQGVNGRIAKAKAKEQVIPDHPIEEFEDQDVAGGFDLFGEDAPASAVASDAGPSIVPGATAPSIVVPPDHIPNSWTGTTPRRVLEDWCRHEKLRPPQFVGNSRVKVYTTPPITIDHGPNDHVVAAQALYEAVPQLPLYRLFPPFYRELWLSWVGADKEQAATEAEAVATERSAKIEWVIGLIPKRSSADSSKGVEVDAPIDTPLSDWDEQSLSETGAKEPSLKDIRLKEMFLKKQQSAEYIEMLEVRRKLPIYDYRNEILKTIERNPVTIICAETGSGKTTQCSSFVLEDSFQRGCGENTSILCTQPRRVAAVSVSERVAEELGESIGNLVGYSIRGESRKSSATRLLFCTTGVILRRLIDDPELRGVSHVVVDEVHERQWQIDILLVFLRALIAGKRPDLKIILMSATLDPTLFSKFFSGAPVLQIPGRTFPVSKFYLEDLLEQTRHVIEEGSRCALRGQSKLETVSMWVTNQGGEKRRETADYIRGEGASGLFPEYSMTTQRSLDLVDETVINYDLIEDVLSALDSSSGPVFATDTKVISGGSVLIFMPGIAEIRTLVERLSASRNFGDSRKYNVIPLHSTLSSDDQRKAFRPSPSGCRKIIVSTNIAETSVTIPDVVFVIDSGRVREIQRDKRTSSRKLIPTWCSRASAKQRAGRAGRVQAGICLKLYTSKTEETTMRASTEPELRRIPLEEVCLSVLASNFTRNCTEFLSQTPQPPTPDAIEAALNVLLEIGAVDRLEESERLTSLGRHLAKLPVDARVGKMLIYGTIFRCVDPILTIAASLSTTKDPFQASQTGDGQVAAAHSSFRHESSDFVSFVNLWAAYRKSRDLNQARKFSREKYVSHATLGEIQDNRFLYCELMVGLGFLHIPMSKNKYEMENALANCRQNQNSNLSGVVDAVVCGGLFPNVGLVAPKSTKETNIFYKTEKLTVQRSVNSKLLDQRTQRWLVFFEKFATLRKVTVSKTALVAHFPLIIFGNNLEVLHTQRKVRVEGWIELDVPAKTALLLREIRYCLDQLLRTLVNKPTTSHRLDDRTSQILDEVTSLLAASTPAVG